METKPNFSLYLHGLGTPESVRNNWHVQTKVRIRLWNWRQNSIYRFVSKSISPPPKDQTASVNEYAIEIAEVLE